MNPPKQRICADCGMPFAATSCRQLRCDTCNADRQELPAGMWHCITHTAPDDFYGMRHALVDWRKIALSGAILACGDRYVVTSKGERWTKFAPCAAPKTTAPLPTGTDLLIGQFYRRSIGRTMKAKVV